MPPVPRRKPSMRRVASTSSLQAPTGGLNAKDSLADMAPSEAVTLENWFPKRSSVDLRAGCASWVTGFADPVETLVSYNNSTTKKLFAGSGTAYYDATSTGAVGAAVKSGLTNVRHQHVTMANAAGHWLMMVNGADKLIGYNGSAWWQDGDGSHDITGVDTADCIDINTFKHRVWLIKKDTFEAWYLPTDAIAGAATKFDLGPIFKLGGSLVGMVNWTINASTGIDDYAAFISSEGEVALYQGTDPASANTWALAGTFRTGRPLGNRFSCKVGADVILLTTDGAFPLSKALLTDNSQLAVAVTDKIGPVFNEAAALYSANFGWQPILHPIGNKLIINVPKLENTDSHQFVMNTTHGAWTKFTGWLAFCWEVHDGELYYGSTDKVYKADTGTDDDGVDIEAVAQQAYNYFGSRGTQKHFTMVRPVFITDGLVNPAVVLNVDFAQNRTAAPTSFSAAAPAIWDEADWDVTDWNVGESVYKKWIGVSAIGYCGGIRVVTATQGVTCRWSSTDFVYELGGTL